MNFFIILILISSLGLTACSTIETQQTISPVETQASTYPVSNAIQLIASKRIRLEEVINKQSSLTDISEKITDLKKVFKELPKMKLGPSVDYELLGMYKQISLEVIGDVEKHIDRSYWDAAKRSLLRIRSIEQDILRDFGP